MLFKSTLQEDRILARGKVLERNTETTTDVLASLFDGKYCKADLLKHLEHVQALPNKEKFIYMANAKLVDWLLEELDGSIHIRTRELYKLLELDGTSKNSLETITILPQYRTPELKLNMSNFKSINTLLNYYG